MICLQLQSDILPVVTRVVEHTLEWSLCPPHC